MNFIVVNRISQYWMKVNDYFLFHIGRPFHLVSLSLPMNDFGFGHFDKFWSIDETFNRTISTIWMLTMYQRWYFKRKAQT